MRLYPLTEKSKGFVIASLSVVGLVTSFLLAPQFVPIAYASCNQLTSGTAGLFAPNTSITLGSPFDCYVFTDTQFHDTTCLITTNNDIDNPLSQSDVHNDCLFQNWTSINGKAAGHYTCNMSTSVSWPISTYHLVGVNFNDLANPGSDPNPEDCSGSNPASPLPNALLTVHLSPTPSPTFTPTPIPTPSPSPTPTATPTVTPIPQNTLFSVTVGLDGLGDAGDALNRHGGNANPRHPTRGITVKVLNSVNQVVAQGSGQIHYQNASGLFIGTIDVGNQLSDGTYFVSVSSPGFMSFTMSQPVTIQSGGTNTIGTIYLSNGNINNDSSIDIVDYNELISCYLNEANTPGCLAPITNNSAGADLNDDGQVDEFDYNLFIRELSAQ